MGTLKIHRSTDTDKDLCSALCFWRGMTMLMSARCSLDCRGSNCLRWRVNSWRSVLYVLQESLFPVFVEELDYLVLAIISETSYYEKKKRLISLNHAQVRWKCLISIGCSFCYPFLPLNGGENQYCKVVLLVTDQSVRPQFKLSVYVFFNKLMAVLSSQVKKTQFGYRLV